MKKIKVLLVDDHDIVIMGIKSLLSRYRDIEIVSVATDGEEALSMTEKYKPNIVLLDINLPKVSGIEVTKHIVKNFPAIKVILHTSYDDGDHIVRGFEAGASGYLPKAFKTEQMIEAIRKVYNGDIYINGSVAEKFIGNAFKPDKSKGVIKNAEQLLTRKEIEILKLIADGLFNQEIADKLFISTRTVETHKYNIMKKLNIRNTIKLMEYAKNNIPSS